MSIQFGTVAVTKNNYQTKPITFAPAFASVPFVTITSHVKEDLLHWKVLNLTAAGFTLEGYGAGQNAYAGNVNWKAETP